MFYLLRAVFARHVIQKHPHYFFCHILIEAVVQVQNNDKIAKAAAPVSFFRTSCSCLADLLPLATMSAILPRILAKTPSPTIMMIMDVITSTELLGVMSPYPTLRIKTTS